MPSDRLVNADTLAAARRWAVFHDEDGVWRIVAEADGADVTWPEMDEADCQRAVDEHNAILAAIPPDPRLDALLAAARQTVDAWDEDAMPEDDGFDPQLAAEAALRDALAAFEVPKP